MAGLKVLSGIVESSPSLNQLGEVRYLQVLPLYEYSVLLV